MSVHLDHTIVAVADKVSAAQWLADILGLTVGAPYGPFLPVETANGGDELDFMDAGDVMPQHYAFLVSEGDFDAIFERLKRAGVGYHATLVTSSPTRSTTRTAGAVPTSTIPTGTASRSSRALTAAASRRHRRQ